MSKIFTSLETIDHDLGLDQGPRVLGACVHLCANPPSRYLCEPQLPTQEARITSAVVLTLGGASLGLRMSKVQRAFPTSSLPTDEVGLS